MKCSGLCGFFKKKRIIGGWLLIQLIFQMVLRHMLSGRILDGENWLYILTGYSNKFRWLTCPLLHNHTIFVFLKKIFGFPFFLSIPWIMDKSFTSRVGLNTKDNQLIQDLVKYAESRFMEILLAIQKVSQHQDSSRSNWMQTCLRQELVSVFLLLGFPLAFYY
jgi:hypothetical protein